MGRIEKQKRLIIEQANKRILGEDTIDFDTVKNLVKYKLDTDITDEDIESFEDQRVDDIDNPWSTEDYANMIGKWKKELSGDGVDDLKIDTDGDEWYPDQKF